MSAVVLRDPATLPARPLLFMDRLILALKNTAVNVWPAVPFDPVKPFKWQTRRVIKIPRRLCASDCKGPSGREWVESGLGAGAYLSVECKDKAVQRVRRWALGDRIWVRETWGLFDTQPKDGPDRATVFYRATDSIDRSLRYQLWRPSIFMPRWASRMMLVVKRKRVERLLQITDEDAIAEGISIENGTDYWLGGPHKVKGTSKVFNSPREAFLDGWDHLNARRGYGVKANPWVEVLDIMRIKPTLD